MTQFSERQLRSRWQHLRGDPDVVLLDGFHAVKHAMRFDAQVLLTVAMDKRATLALASSLAGDIADTLAGTLVEIPRAVYQQVVSPQHPTGVAALARKPAADVVDAVLRVELRRSPAIVLDNPRNLGNLGAVIRLAAGLGASGVVTTGSTDPWHPHAVRGSAGLHFAVPVRRVGDEDFPSGPLLALDPDGVDIRSVGIPDDALLAFGSERHGISADLKRRAEALIAIPMRPKVSSYNLATSVAMALFHWLSRPDGPPP